MQTIAPAVVFFMRCHMWNYALSHVELRAVACGIMRCHVVNDLPLHKKSTDRTIICRCHIIS